MIAAQQRADPSLQTFVRKNIQRAQAVVRNPEILKLWGQWQLGQRLGGDPKLRMFNCEFGHYPHFNAYLGSWHYRPTSDEFAFLTESLSKAEFIFDIGANFGVISCIAARRRPSARIFAFEPHPQTFRSLEANLRDNGIANVQAFELALGARAGEIGFTSHGSPASNRIATGSEAAIRVPVTTLAEFCRDNSVERIDFLKIDVEGADLDVLEGARPLFEAGAVAAGMIEVCPGTLARFGRSVDEMIEFFESVGLDLRWYGRGGEVVGKVPRGLSDPGFLANAVFTRSHR